MSGWDEGIFVVVAMAVGTLFAATAATAVIVAVGTAAATVRLLLR